MTQAPRRAPTVSRFTHRRGVARRRAVHIGRELRTTPHATTLLKALREVLLRHAPADQATIRTGRPHERTTVGGVHDTGAVPLFHDTRQGHRADVRAWSTTPPDSPKHKRGPRSRSRPGPCGRSSLAPATDACGSCLPETGEEDCEGVEIGRHDLAVDRVGPNARQEDDRVPPGHRRRTAGVKDGRRSRPAQLEFVGEELAVDPLRRGEPLTAAGAFASPVDAVAGGDSARSHDGGFGVPAKRAGHFQRGAGLTTRGTRGSDLPPPAEPGRLGATRWVNVRRLNHRRAVILPGCGARRRSVARRGPPAPSRFDSGQGTVHL